MLRQRSGTVPVERVVVGSNPGPGGFLRCWVGGGVRVRLGVLKRSKLASCGRLSAPGVLLIILFGQVAGS